MKYETRALPKKTIILIFVVSIAIIGTFLFLQHLKEQKIIEILAPLGHKNISNVKFINKLDVEDIVTKMKSSVFKVAFFDNDLNKTCVGFLHQEKDRSYKKDIDCK